MINRKAQVWIETVLYTIIGLAIIGTVLAFVMPKINQSRDNVMIEQGISAMKELDAKIRDVAKQQGNIGRIEFSMKKGYLYINSSNDNIIFVLNEITSIYSEPNVSINDGNVKILTEKGQKENTVYLAISYPYNLTFMDTDNDKKLTAASLAYQIYIENKGNNQINIAGS